MTKSPDKRPGPVRRAWRGILPWLAACLAVAASVTAAAQDRPGAQAPALQKPDPAAPKPSPTLPSTGESLSNRLDRGDGVIKPPANVDPDMHVAPKDPTAGQSMPVIPPPGSPGGDQSVQPK
jgi:hypothetical protein